MRIPPDRLSDAALDGLIAEFVTRDGTDLADLADKARRLRAALRDGRAQIHFDPDSESCHIVAVEPGARAGDGGRPA